MKVAEIGISELHKAVDTLIIIPNQNLFRVANEKTTFADVRSIMSEMGKAMMGTGEATGEKRAVLAAEAAIANPLLDETSMKGARGLLISITGGNDLTLYEVDEAASRIRQEVDEEANIILGATFEPSLDGVVRVSVVATGIDQAILSQLETISVPARAETPRARASAHAPVRAAPSPPIEAQLAPVHHDVEIVPVAPTPSAFPEPIEGRREPDEEPDHFIPPAPEQPMARTPRMPQIEDLPQVAQKQIRAAMREAPAAPASLPPETRRRSLLEKLAAFGITRHEDERPQAAAAPAPAPAAPPPPQSQPVAGPTPVPVLARPQPAHAPSEYGRHPPRPHPVRSAAGSLDPHGRAAARPPITEDDHLEIPAFLRRQPN